MSNLNPAQELRSFIAAVCDPTEIYQSRLIGRDRTPVSNWHTQDELLASTPYFLKQNAEGLNIYLGINPRAARGLSGDGNVRFAQLLFVDFDHTDLSDALARVNHAGLPLPSMVNWSGFGCHVYWKLSLPMFDLREWRRLQQGLIAILGSDKTIHNPERILRVPGFNNLKKDPTPAYVVHAADDVYDLRIFAALVDAIPKPPAPPLPPPMPRPSSSSSSSLKIFDANPSRWFDLALQRARSEGRNNAGLWFAAQMRDDGLSEQEAEGWMRKYAASVPDAGHTYHEHEATSSLKQAFKRPPRGPARKLTGTTSWLPTHMRHSSRVMNRGSAQ